MLKVLLVCVEESEAASMDFEAVCLFTSKRLAPRTDGTAWAFDGV